VLGTSSTSFVMSEGSRSATNWFGWIDEGMAALISRKQRESNNAAVVHGAALCFSRPFLYARTKKRSADRVHDDPEVADVICQCGWCIYVASCGWVCYSRLPYNTTNTSPAADRQADSGNSNTRRRRTSLPVLDWLPSSSLNHPSLPLCCQGTPSWAWHPSDDP
jgi:hypothetical protein